VTQQEQEMKRSLKTVNAFADSGPFSSGQLRWYIFNEATNGMRDHCVVVRIGRRVYIDVDAFDRWVDSQQVAA
jgi:hypothetical protein